MAWPHAVTTTTTFFLDTKTTVVIKQIDLEYQYIDVRQERDRQEGEKTPSKGRNLREQIWWAREGATPRGLAHSRRSTSRSDIKQIDLEYRGIDIRQDMAAGEARRTWRKAEICGSKFGGGERGLHPGG